MNWLGTVFKAPLSASPRKWEWNHDPDEKKHEIDNQLRGNFGKPHDTLLAASAERLPCAGTIHVDFSGMADGDDLTWPAVHNNISASIKVFSKGDIYTVCFRGNMAQENSVSNTWCTSTGARILKKRPKRACSNYGLRLYHCIIYIHRIRRSRHDTSSSAETGLADDVGDRRYISRCYSRQRTHKPSTTPRFRDSVGEVTLV